ncbi:MAG: methyltransferase domain-containing protein [Anaerolineales bacterium]|nr:methyltransferase domain-containing protein [Anaerolineales bacterium]
MLLPARRPTLARWRALSGTTFSLLRSLEYERLAGLRLTGRVLDVGGGLRNDYTHLFELAGTLDSVNIDPTRRPSCLADLNRAWPLAASCYDGVISLNTLEHLVNDRLALAEMARILKPGGVAYLVVPFIYRVHGSPYDYHRHTAAAWIEMLVAAGFARSQIQVEPLAFGRLASGFALVEFLWPPPARWLMKKAVMLAMVAREALRRGPVAEEMDVPLGYFITAVKESRPG